MGSSVKVVSFAVLSVLLLQLHAVHSSDEFKDPSEVLKRLDETEKTLSKDVDDHISSAVGYIQETFDRIKNFDYSQIVQRLLHRSLNDARINVREVRKNMQKHICNRFRDVQQMTRATPPTADIAAFIKTAEYEPKLEEGASKINKNMLLRLSNRLGDRERHEDLVKINRAEEPSMANLDEWKKYFVYKTEWTHKIHDEAMERLREASAYTLHTLRDAVAVWSGDKEGLTAKKETPSDAAQKALLVGAALGINDILECDE